MKKKMATVVAGAAVAAGMIGATAPQASATQRCPTYFGCVYSGTSQTSGYFIFEQEKYGTFPVHNWFHNHLAVNSQTGGAYMQGLDSHKHVLWTLQDGRSYPRSKVANMTPVYYIKLSPGPSCWPRCQ